MDPEFETDEATERLWRDAIIHGHRSKLAFLPGTPRCAICRIPLRGAGGRLANLRGYRPSIHNPNICNYCEDLMPIGGAEVDTAVMFADVRGATGLGEQMGSREYTQLINRFYTVVSDVLVKRLAYIDKLVGDQVMALFYEGNTGQDYRIVVVDAAHELMQQLGYAPDQEPWLPVGAAVHWGPAFFGKLGTGGIYTMTAIGDTINTAAHLQEAAAAGEILITESIYPAVQDRYPDLEIRSVALRGKDEPVPVRVLRPAFVAVPAAAPASAP